MKALVLCGGIPQVELIKQLKARNITVVLADMNKEAPAVSFADVFYPVSTLDVEGIRNLAVAEKVDFLITACADQMIVVVAQVSEMLGLPCYITYETAKKVSDKRIMKREMSNHGIPTSKYIIMDEFDRAEVEHLQYPLIVKPVDSYSSRGVKKVFSLEEAECAFSEAKAISRTHSALIEEFVEGTELTVDVYVERGTAHILCLSEIDKIPGGNKFVIHRLKCPAFVSADVQRQIAIVAQKIAEVFEITDSPMLLQLIVNGERLSVVEFCARTGGGDKFRLIKEVTGFDVISAVIDLTLGIKPQIILKKFNDYIIDEFLYCKAGILDHLEGFDELQKNGTITEYFQLKPQGSDFDTVGSSGDRVAYFTVKARDPKSALEKHKDADKAIKAVSIYGEDLLRHDLVQNINCFEQA